MEVGGPERVFFHAISRIKRTIKVGCHHDGPLIGGNRIDVGDRRQDSHSVVSFIRDYQRHDSFELKFPVSEAVFDYRRRVLTYQLAKSVIVH